MIERTEPIRIHKNLVIRCLHEHPEDLAQIAPDFKGSAKEFIAALTADPREWIVGGELR